LPGGLLRQDRAHRRGRDDRGPGRRRSDARTRPTLEPRAPGKEPDESREGRVDEGRRVGEEARSEDPLMLRLPGKGREALVDDGYVEVCGTDEVPAMMPR